MSEFSAFVIAAPSTGAGKTTVSLALMAALRERGLRVQPFKMGPDYIDPAYHAAVCGRPSINLDTWMTSESFVRETFAHHVRDADAAIVEGVMGLFDGAGGGSEYGSTAHVAKLLGLPVVLVVDAYTASESVAAVALGCARFDPALNVGGIIAARTAGAGQYDSIRAALSRTELPLLGQLPIDGALRLPERHLGLVSVFEHPLEDAWKRRASVRVCRYLDVDALLNRTHANRPSTIERHGEPVTARIAVARDHAFCFYYEDNLRLLREAGAELLPYSPLDDPHLPTGAQGVYFGGGFPETAASELAANAPMLNAIRGFDGAIWAECGGLMYLCETFTDLDGTRHTMAGRVPGATIMTESLQGFGYREATLAHDCPLGNHGDTFRGHEFHWSRWQSAPSQTCAAFVPAMGDQGYANAQTIASYVHVHLGLRPEAAKAFVERGLAHCTGGILPPSRPSP